MYCSFSSNGEDTESWRPRARWTTLGRHARRHGELNGGTQGVVWIRDPHTEASTKFCVPYLDAYFPIMAKHWASTGICFVDAFAGPGEYSDRSLGSPILALIEPSGQTCWRLSAVVHLVYVEKDPKRYAPPRRDAGCRDRSLSLQGLHQQGTLRGCTAPGAGPDFASGGSSLSPTSTASALTRPISSSNALVWPRPRRCW